MAEAEFVRVAPDSLAQFCAGCFEKLGLSQKDAKTATDNLIFANLRGVDSHGVIRLKIYADRLRAGGFNPRGRPKIVGEGDGEALVDAGNALGQIGATHAMNVAVSKARKTGVGFVGVRNSNHFGAAAHYALMAVEEQMIGLAATNAGATMAPSGGREARLGNNPLAVAVPAGKNRPLVLDMATGAVAWGKIFLAQQEKKKIPTTWALDAGGVPTDDPDKAAFRGLIQPLGGHKGYGLSLMIDILTGVLCGSGFSTQVSSLYKKLEEPSRCAHFCAAIRIDTFIPVDEFCGRVDEIIDLMRSCPPAPSIERIYVPGEIEDETEEQRRVQGIPISAVLKDELRALGEELDVESPF